MKEYPFIINSSAGLVRQVSSIGVKTFVYVDVGVAERFNVAGLSSSMHMFKTISVAISYVEINSLAVLDSVFSITSNANAKRKRKHLKKSGKVVKII